MTNSVHPPAPGALRQLAASLRGSQIVLIEAACKDTDKLLVKLLYRIADERAAMERALDSHIRAADSIAEDDAADDNAPDTVAARHADIPRTLHQAWEAIRQALAAGDSDRVLDELERSEAAIVEQYQRVLRGCPAGPLNQLLQAQLREARRGHQQAVELRESRQCS